MKISELYVGDRFKTVTPSEYEHRLWTLVDYNDEGEPICRVHSTLEHGYIGDAICYFPLDTEIEFVPPEVK